MEHLDPRVRSHLETVSGVVRRRDAETLIEMYGRITTEPAQMWGPSIIGFGAYHYEYPSGRSGDEPAGGFSPRKAATSIYLADGIAVYSRELARLGSHTSGVACLYVRDLAHVDLAVLEEIVAASYRAVTATTWPARARDGEPRSGTSTPAVDGTTTD